MHDHFYKEENCPKKKRTYKKYEKKKSLVPIVLESNYYNLMYNVKRHYFTHHDV